MKRLGGIRRRSFLRLELNFFAEERKSFGGKMMKYFALTTLSQNNDWFQDMKHLTLIGAKQTFLSTCSKDVNPTEIHPKTHSYEKYIFSIIHGTLKFQLPDWSHDLKQPIKMLEFLKKYCLRNGSRSCTFMWITLKLC